MKNNKIISIFSIILCLSMLLSVAVFSEESGNTAETTTKIESKTENIKEKSYREVSKKYSFKDYNGDDLEFNAETFATIDNCSVRKDIENCDFAVSVNQGQKTDFNIDVKEDALYSIKVRYFDMSESTLPIKCNVLIDDDAQFSEMYNQTFEGEWVYKTSAFAKDRFENEIVPESVRKNVLLSKCLSDSSALYYGAFKYELKSGNHKITFKSIQGTIVIKSISLIKTPKYEYQKSGKAKGDEIKIIEGENIGSKSDASVCPSGEYDPAIYPYSFKGLKMNMLSASSFSDGGVRVTYNFTVDKTGYYNLGFKYRQNSKTDFSVFRNVYVDGKIYSKNHRNVQFPYSRSFEIKTLTDNVYLEREKTHTITIEVSLDLLEEAVLDVNKLISDINELSLQIMKITGNSTSKYRDFDVDSYIPGIDKQLECWAEKIQEIYNNLCAINGNKGDVGEFSTLKICVEQLKSLAANVNDIPNRINELYQGDSSVNQYLANTLESLYSSPLAIDRIFVYQDDAKLPKDLGFFAKIWKNTERFFYSFVRDYSLIDDDEKTLNIWVNRSRLYVDLMQKMADDSFYSKTGIKVNFSLMPNEEKLVLASAANNTPDVALGVTYTIPYELAIRGAIYNLKNFDDFDDISKRFAKGIVDVGAVDDGRYLLPETNDFLVLFYRKDILNELNISVPNTMDDVKSIIPVLKRYGMDFYSHIAGHSGTKTLSVLVPFIYQNNARIYGETARDLQIGSNDMVKAYEEMSDLFNIYDIPYEISNFYQHFRSGSIPLGISGFNTYMMLLNSAPEIAGVWGVAPYPGYKDQNGKVNRYISGAQSTGVIFSSSKNKEGAWEFLKWWTSTDIQKNFADTLQLTYGNEYMWNTSNLEAFKKLPLNEEHKAAIFEMMNWIVEVPRVPGTYMTQRSLSNALNNVILDGNNIRKELNKASKDIAAEVDSKLEEFGYMKNGKVIKEYKIAS